MKDYKQNGNVIRVFQDRGGFFVMKIEPWQREVSVYISQDSYTAREDLDLALRLQTVKWEHLGEFDYAG